jgi:hypothetical protein
LYEHVLKPAPTKGGEAEAVATEDVTCTSIGFCSTVLDGLAATSFLQYIIIYQHTSRPQNKEKEKSSLEQELSSVEVGEVSLEVSHHQ